MKANPELLKPSPDGSAKEQQEANEGEGEDRGEPADGNQDDGAPAIDKQRLRYEEKRRTLNSEWKRQLLCEHLIYVKGVELVMYEFREVLLELALRLKDYVDSAPGKLRSLVKKFLDELFLKRLIPYIKHNQLGEFSNTKVEEVD